MKDKNSYLNLAILFFSALVLVYFIPSTFNKILFPLYCVLFYKSKSNVLWIVFFFLLIESPGGLFSGGERMDLLRLPIYNLAAGVSITFEQLFCITALLKVFKKKAKYKPLGFLSRNLMFMGLYFIFLIFLSFFLGNSFDSFRFLYKIIINLTLLYSLYFLFSEESDFVGLFKLIFPLAFIALFLQLYDLIFDHQLIALFKPGVLSTQGVFGLVETTRPIEMAHIVFIAFYGSMYFLILNKNIFNQKYLIIVNVISYSSIFITGSRAWFIAFTSSYLLLLLFLPGNMMKITVKNSLVLGLTVLTLFSLAILKSQFSHAYQRIKTIELVVKGDMTAGGTLGRFTERAPNVMKAFKKSSFLFGAGFSDFYWQNNDQHVGFHNILFNSGIIGVIFPLIFVLNIVYFSLKIGIKLKKCNPYKNALKIFALWMVAILLLNSSTQFIGYDVYLVRILVLSIFIYFFNNQIKNAVNFRNSYSD